MEKTFSQEIKISILKRITGRQDPSISRIIASIIIIIVAFLLTFYAGFYLNKALTKPNANVVFHPHVEDNSYLPMMVTNGPKPLTEGILKVRTCHMRNFKEFNIPKLIEYQEYPVQLKDTETVYAMDKILNSSDFTCDPLNISAETQCFIKTYIVNGKIYAPAQECKRYRCGYCQYEVYYKTKEFSFNLTSHFISPMEISTYRLKIIPTIPINFSENDMKPFSPIGISLFSPFDLCMLRTKNNYDICKNLQITPLFNGSLTFRASPVNESLGNLTVNITQVIWD